MMVDLTIQLDENESAHVSEELVETQPPDQVEFVAEGVLTITQELMGEFEGTTLKPTEVVLSVDNSDTVTVDLTQGPSLRLEDVDVGVETPNVDGISPGMSSPNSTSDESTEAPEINPGAIAFTVEGAILNVPQETFEPLSEGELTLSSITFAGDDVAKSDGGSNENVVLEVTVLGYGVVVYRNGIIEVGTAGRVTDIGLR